jgi:O-antigen/teichoic acid export membrane protein
MRVREIDRPALLGLTPSGTLPLAAPALRPLSLRSNFAWVVAGNAVYAFCQWGMIIALTKFGNSFMVGQFSLGLAVVTPVLVLSNLNLRAVQATDALRQFRFAEYLRLRLASTLAGLAVIAVIVHFGAYGNRTAAVILALALVKAIETLSDIHYGLFQLNDRLDQTGWSMILRGALAVTALSAGLCFTHSVFWGCIWVAVAWLVTLFVFDVRRGRRVVACTECHWETEPAARPPKIQLLFLALPLGIVTTIAAITLHMPRYFVYAHMGEHELGIFSALAYATASLTLVGDSLATSAVPRLARLYAGGKLAEYRTLLFQLVAIGCAIGLAGLAMVHYLGARLLTIFYNADYAAHSRIFTVLMAAAALHFAASMLTSGITSARCFRIQVPLYTLVAASTAWGCARWVPTLGLAGAAFGVTFGAAVRLLLAGAVMLYLLLPGNRIQQERASCNDLFTRL